MDLAEEEEAVTVEVITVAVTVAVTVAITAAVKVAVTVEVITAVVSAVVTVAILKLLLLLPINLLVQKVGQIEVIVILLKTLNMRVVEAGEKEEYLMIKMLQIKEQISLISYF